MFGALVLWGRECVEGLGVGVAPRTYVERVQRFFCPEKFRRPVAKALSWFIMSDTWAGR